MEGDGKAERCFIGFGSDQKWKTAALLEAAVAASWGSKQLQTDQKSEAGICKIQKAHKLEADTYTKYIYK